MFSRIHVRRPRARDGRVLPVGNSGVLSISWNGLPVSPPLPTSPATPQRASVGLQQTVLNSFSAV